MYISGTNTYKCEGPVRCGKKNFCVGYEKNYVYCYGSSDGCKWGTNDCTEDGHCAKYTSLSPKYTDGAETNCTHAVGWWTDGCTCRMFIFYLSSV